jgi:RNA-binding protein YhbY
MELFTLFTKYHEITFKELKNSLIESVSKEIMDLLNNNKHLKTNICGHPRSQNRGKCKRLCRDKACSYHMKYIDKLNKTNISNNINTQKSENIDNVKIFILKII